MYPKAQIEQAHALQMHIQGRAGSTSTVRSDVGCWRVRNGILCIQDQELEFKELIDFCTERVWSPDLLARDYSPSSYTSPDCLESLYKDHAVAEMEGEWRGGVLHSQDKASQLSSHNLEESRCCLGTGHL